jgi:hypothetical protein
MTKGKERGGRGSGKVDPNEEPTRKLPVRGAPMEDEKTRPFASLRPDDRTAHARAAGRTTGGEQLEDDDLEDDEDDGDLDEEDDLDEGLESEELDDEMEEMEDLEDLEDDEEEDDDEDDDAEA